MKEATVTSGSKFSFSLIWIGHHGSMFAVEISYRIHLLQIIDDLHKFCFIDKSNPSLKLPDNHFAQTKMSDLATRR